MVYEFKAILYCLCIESQKCAYELWLPLLAHVAQIVLGVLCLILVKMLEAPYKWRHAGLAELKDFLLAEKRAGRFHPLLSEGLED